MQFLSMDKEKRINDIISIIIIGMGVLFVQNYISGAEEVFPYKSIIFNT